MKYRRLLFGVIISIIVIILVIVIMLNLLNKDTKDPNQSENNINQANVSTNDNIYIDQNISSGNNISSNEDKQDIISRSEYYMVKNAISRLYLFTSEIRHSTDNLSLLTEDEIKEMNSAKATAIYNLLEKEYIQYKGITQDNMISKLGDIFNINNASLKIYINQIYVTKQNEDKIKIYFVQGTLLDTNNTKFSDFSMIINTDLTNNTFSLILGDYVSEKIGEISKDSKISYEVSEIKQNENNTLDNPTVSDGEYVTDLYDEYKYNSLYNPKSIYNKLDKDYKEARFPTAEKFKEYLEKDKIYIARTNISKYMKNEKEGYNQYVCLDTNGNYLFIYEKSPIEYTYIIDNHTINYDEFITKYDKATNQVKVGMNANKIFDAIDTFDYEYVYNKLDETFKKNNYNTLEKFEKYIQQNLYKKNKVEYIDYSEDGQVCVYKVKITDRDDSSKKEKNVTIVMQLLEDRNFVMSFSIE